MGLNRIPENFVLEEDQDKDLDDLLFDITNEAISHFVQLNWLQLPVRNKHLPFYTLHKWHIIAPRLCLKIGPALPREGDKKKNLESDVFLMPQPSQQPYGRYCLNIF